MPHQTKPPVIQFHFQQAGFHLSDRTLLKSFINQLFKAEKRKLEDLQYIFCTDRYLLTINRQFLQHDFYTDIISFDLSEKGQAVKGEIYISIDRVRENAVQFKSSFKRELHRVLFHGALHLCGYKDKTLQEQQLMRKMEEKYLLLYFKE